MNPQRSRAFGKVCKAQATIDRFTNGRQVLSKPIAGRNGKRLSHWLNIRNKWLQAFKSIPR